MRYFNKVCKQFIILLGIIIVFASSALSQQEQDYQKQLDDYEKQKKRLELEKTAQMAVFAVEDAQRRVRLYETTLVPQARQTYESLLSRYATGAGDAGFLDVLDSVQTLLMFELELVRAARDWQVGAADLEYLLGGPWDL